MVPGLIPKIQNKISSTLLLSKISSSWRFYTKVEKYGKDEIITSHKTWWLVSTILETYCYWKLFAVLAVRLPWLVVNCQRRHSVDGPFCLSKIAVCPHWLRVLNCRTWSRVLVVVLLVRATYSQHQRNIVPIICVFIDKMIDYFIFHASYWFII